MGEQGSVELWSLQRLRSLSLPCVLGSNYYVLQKGAGMGAQQGWESPTVVLNTLNP